jgi:hypothetical protein
MLGEVFGKVSLAEIVLIDDAHHVDFRTAHLIITSHMAETYDNTKVLN